MQAETRSSSSSSSAGTLVVLAGTLGLFGLIAGLEPSVALAAPGSPGDTTELAQIWSRTVDFFSLRYNFLLYTIAGSCLVGLTCGLLGCFMVLRRMSLMGDALGHAALPGIGLAFLVVQAKEFLPILIGASSTALLAALLIGYITRNSRTRPDAALGLVLAGFFGVGVVLLSYLQNSPSGAQSGLQDFLFGNAAAIKPTEVWFLLGLFALSAALVGLLYRPLQLMTFDATLARSMGVPVRWLHYGMMALVSVAIVASMQSVGVVLVAAMIIIPPSTARLLTDRLHWMLLLAPALGAVAGVGGAWLSFLFDGFSSGPSMVLIAALLFALAFILAPRHGLFPRWWRDRSRRRRLAHRQDSGELTQLQEPAHSRPLGALTPSHRDGLQQAGS